MDGIEFLNFIGSCLLLKIDMCIIENRFIFVWGAGVPVLDK